MKKRFFLDRVNRLGADLSVGRRRKRTLLVHPYTADAVLAVIDRTAMAAQRALDRIIF
jgi:hypothetical protein